MWLDVNGERMQTGNTKTMIFGAAALVSYISRIMTLLPGDIINAVLAREAAANLDAEFENVLAGRFGLLQLARLVDVEPRPSPVCLCRTNPFCS